MIVGNWIDFFVKRDCSPVTILDHRQADRMPSSGSRFELFKTVLKVPSFALQKISRNAITDIQRNASYACHPPRRNKQIYTSMYLMLKVSGNHLTLSYVEGRLCCD